MSCPIQRNSVFLVSAALVLGLSGMARGTDTTYYVNGGCGINTWSGLSPVCQGPDGPKKSIQAGIDAAADGDEVVIAAGTYTGSPNRDLDFDGKAITVRSTDPNDPDVVAATIIDCQQAGRGFIFQSEETLESVVDGVTVVNGFALDGAGVYLVNGSSATIKNCVFTGNTVPISSGVFFSGNAPTQRADLVIINCTISDNLGGGFAAFAIENLTVTGSIISGNSGTGIDTGFPFSPFPNLIVRNSTIVDNDGGGIMTNQVTTIELANCTVADNGGTGIVASEVSFGGGVMITNCTITGNTSDEGTGGLRCEASTSAVIRNCLISNNTGRVGGGLAISSFAAFEITGCTLAGNVSTEFGGGGIRTFGTEPVAIRNCILSGNVAPEGSQLLLDSGFNNPSVVSVDFSTVEGGEKGVFVDEACCSPSELIWGVGNVEVDPQFVDPGSGDYHVAATSPSIDAGDPAFVAEADEVDLDGHARVLCDRVDMGAYEFGIGDHDCDRDVDLFDFAGWAACSTGPDNGPYADGCEAFDFDGDLDVDFEDFRGFQLVFSGP